MSVMRLTLRQRLLGYLLLVHGAGLLLAARLLLPSPLLFVGVELLILASLAGGVWLMQRALQPLGYTERFRDLLQEQQYSGRLALTGTPELDRLIDVFNTMLGALYQERLAIGEQRGFLAQLLDATPAAVVVFDFDGAVSLVNASAVALLQLQAPQGRPLAAAAGSARSAALLAQLEALTLGPGTLLTDLEGRRYRAQRGQFFDRGFARDFLMVEELTIELERSERATYDKLIKVLAHEVNNTVAATGSVLDSLLFYRAQLAPDDGVDFATAIDAVQRRNRSMGEFIERFTRVVKMPDPELRPVDIGAMVDDIVWLNREQCKRLGIALVWTRRDALAPWPMDAQLIEQALINIVKNAIEAVAASAAPERRIELALAASGAGARLTISDSGNLLGEAPARQLFTPFFSTKKGGQGIGLMFVREVLSRHGFGYRLAADQGMTRFEIAFT
ncbi:sensor histidine kinase [Massilia sp. DWR3-1-1]|uniref:sensor histidine kinase n=1 Tax=Massilia sp. DWR3-1-1 TaxID=2804559 RepID=UPI003CF7D28A